MLVHWRYAGISGTLTTFHTSDVRSANEDQLPDCGKSGGGRLSIAGRQCFAGLYNWRWVAKQRDRVCPWFCINYRNKIDEKNSEFWEQKVWGKCVSFWLSLGSTATSSVVCSVSEQRIMGKGVCWRFVVCSDLDRVQCWRPFSNHISYYDVYHWL